MWYVLAAFKGYPALQEVAYKPGDVVPDEDAEAMALISKPDLAEWKDAPVDPKDP